MEKTHIENLMLHHKLKLPHMMVFIVCTISAETYAEEPICQQINNSKFANVFLTKNNFTKDEGPIYFGDYASTFADGQALYYIPTEYYVITNSKQVSAVNSDMGGTLHLEAAKPACKNSNTYKVFIVLKAANQDLLPMKIRLPIHESNFEDTRSIESIDQKITLKFKPEISGRLVRHR